MDLQERVREFMQKTLGAMGVPLDVAVIDESDSVRVELSGDGGEQLLRRRAEALDALQHIVNTAFRRELKDDRSFVVDCLDYRKGKDAELKQMARYMMERAKTTGTHRRWDRSTPMHDGSCTSPSPRMRRCPRRASGMRS